MQRILSMQRDYVAQNAASLHQQIITTRKAEDIVVLSLHFCHSHNLLLAGTHRGSINVFFARSLQQDGKHDVSVPVSPFSSFIAHDGCLRCIASSGDMAVTGGDDIIHVWPLSLLSSRSFSTGPPPAPLFSLLPPQYALPSRAVSPLPSTVALTVIPASSTLISAHSNGHVLIFSLTSRALLSDLHPAVLPAAVNALLYVPPSSLLTGDDDGLVSCWSLSESRCKAVLDVDQRRALSADEAKAAGLKPRAAVLSLSAAASPVPSTASSSALVLCLTRAGLHCFWYPSLLFLASCPLSFSPSVLCSSFLFSAASPDVHRVDSELAQPTVQQMADAEDGEQKGGAKRGGAVFACCVREGERCSVDDLLFAGGAGSLISAYSSACAILSRQLRCR
jgi:WD40 repeat protein